jgi:hypothetical protein
MENQVVTPMTSDAKKVSVDTICFLGVGKEIL